MLSLQTSERGRSPLLKRGQYITVDYYKALTDDYELEQWFIDNTDEGIGVKCVDYDECKGLIWIENCPYAIPSYICYKD